MHEPRSKVENLFQREIRGSKMLLKLVTISISKKIGRIITESGMQWNKDRSLIQIGFEDQIYTIVATLF